MSDTPDLEGIIACLKAGTALMATATGVWLDAAPGDTEYPFVLVSLYAPANEALFEGHWENNLYSVEVVDDGPDATQASALAALVAAQLTKENLTIEGKHVHRLRREQRIMRREAYSETEVYWHVGGLYRVSYI